MKIAIRADASLQIGTGHVMRCLTLADALKKRGGECYFICREHEGNLIEHIRERDHTVHILTGIVDEQGDGARTRSILGKIRPTWLIVDHYALGAGWEKAAKPDGIRLMVIDDLTSRPHVCDLLLNQNLGAQTEDYAKLVPANARILAGPRFALVRPEFAAKRKAEPPKLAHDHWLASVGGVDPKNILGKIVSAWEQLPTPRPSLALAVGSKSQNIASLTQLISSMSGVSLHQDADMAELMSKAGLVIGTTGTMSWERCCLGLPSIMGITAENQRPVCEALVQHHAGISVGEWEKIAPKKLVAMFEKARQHPELLEKIAARAWKIVDGYGAGRVAACLMLERTALRPATSADAELAYSWRNDAATRRYFFDSEPIDHNRHLEWWRQSLSSSTRNLLIAEIHGQPMGVLRLDHANDEATVSIYIDPNFVGLHLGTAILKAGAVWCRKEHGKTRRLVAEILPENKASLSAFSKAGFIQRGEKWFMGI
jgi:UDP-2,4-diacetamido-2,4,6-trideoxy-beta-L-altropyranose hydrolase